MSIYLDGRPVGAAMRAHVNASTRQVRLEGLDGLAELFFSTWLPTMGPSPLDPPLGWFTLREGEGDWIDLPDATVVSYSSGTGRVVLASSGLHRLTEPPPLRAPA